MAWIDRIMRRKSVGQTALDRLIMRLEGTNSAAGVHVNEQTAMRVAAVYACVRVIAETIGALPLNMYRRRTDGGRERATEHPLQILLHDRPNSWQTSQEFREMLTEHALLRGAGFAYINWRSRESNIVDELIPLHPDRITIKQLPDMQLVYELRREQGDTITLRADEVFTLRYRTSDGVQPVGVIESGRDSIGVAYATQEYAGRFYRNDATPGVVLKHPAKLSAEAAGRLKDTWNSAYAGSGNARRTALLEEGMSIERLSLSNDDSQFLQTREYQRSEIAGLFRVPPHLIGDLSRATFSNIEHQSLDFLAHCIGPWMTRWEQSISRDLVTAPATYFPKLSPEALLRGDLKSRYDAYAIGRNWGWLSVNDVRRLEDLNPIGEGEVYLQPLNMTAAGEPVAAPQTRSRKAVYRGEEIDLSPTAGMKAEAEKGLAWREEYGRGGTQVGVSRARDILNANELSPDTVRRMFSYFSRHEVDKQGEGWSPGEDGFPSAGRIAWALWGGDAGFAWSRAKVEQLDRLDESEG